MNLAVRMVESFVASESKHTRSEVSLTVCLNSLLEVEIDVSLRNESSIHGKYFTIITGYYPTPRYATINSRPISREECLYEETSTQWTQCRPGESQTLCSSGTFANAESS